MNFEKKKLLIELYLESKAYKLEATQKTSIHRVIDAKYEAAYNFFEKRMFRLDFPGGEADISFNELMGDTLASLGLNYTPSRIQKVLDAQVLNYIKHDFNLIRMYADTAILKSNLRGVIVVESNKTNISFLRDADDVERTAYIKSYIDSIAPDLYLTYSKAGRSAQFIESNKDRSLKGFITNNFPNYIKSPASSMVMTTVHTSDYVYREEKSFKMEDFDTVDNFVDYDKIAQQLELYDNKYLSNKNGNFVHALDLYKRLSFQDHISSLTKHTVILHEDSAFDASDYRTKKRKVMEDIFVTIYNNIGAISSCNILKYVDLIRRKDRIIDISTNKLVPKNNGESILPRAKNDFEDMSNYLVYLKDTMRLIVELHKLDRYLYSIKKNIYSLEPLHFMEYRKSLHKIVEEGHFELVENQKVYEKKLPKGAVMCSERILSRDFFQRLSRDYEIFPNMREYLDKVSIEGYTFSLSKAVVESKHVTANKTSSAGKLHLLDLLDNTSTHAATDPKFLDVVYFFYLHIMQTYVTEANLKFTEVLTPSVNLKEELVKFIKEYGQNEIVKRQFKYIMDDMYDYNLEIDYRVGYNFSVYSQEFTNYFRDVTVPVLNNASVEAISYKLFPNNNLDILYLHILNSEALYFSNMIMKSIYAVLFYKGELKYFQEYKKLLLLEEIISLVTSRQNIKLSEYLDLISDFFNLFGIEKVNDDHLLATIKNVDGVYTPLSTIEGLALKDNDVIVKYLHNFTEILANIIVRNENIIGNFQAKMKSFRDVTSKYHFNYIKRTVIDIFTESVRNQLQNIEKYINVACSERINLVDIQKCSKFSDNMSAYFKNTSALLYDDEARVFIYTKSSDGYYYFPTSYFYEFRLSIDISRVIHFDTEYIKLLSGDLGDKYRKE